MAKWVRGENARGDALAKRGESIIGKRIEQGFHCFLHVACYKNNYLGIHIPQQILLKSVRIVNRIPFLW